MGSHPTDQLVPFSTRPRSMIMKRDAGPTRGSDVNRTKPQEDEAQQEDTMGVQPDMNDILEALRLTKLLWPSSSPSKQTTSWSIDEHERFLRALQKYPQGPYEWITQYIGTRTLSEVEAYGVECWKSETYQEYVARRRQRKQAAEEKVKVEKEEPTEDRLKVEDVELSAAETPPKRHRVRKWFRQTLEWCVDALSFRCLRCQKPATYRSRSADVNFYGLVQARGLTPSRNRQDSPPAAYELALYDFTAVAAANFAPIRAAAGQPSRPHFLGEPLDAASVRQYAPTYTRLDTDDDDDSDMRSARQAAAEIEWYDEATKPRALLHTQQKSGAWSKDEHERYCEGLETYRFGSWKLIAEYVGTRTESQVRSHAQSVRAKRKRAEERETRHQTGAVPLSPRANGLTGANKSARTTAATDSRSLGTPSSLPSAKVRKLTPEEFLLGSMANSVAARNNLGHLHNVADKCRYGAASVYADIPTYNSKSGGLCLGVEVPFHARSGVEITDNPPVTDATSEISDRCESEVSVPENQANASPPKQSAVNCVGASPDVPLCSPPLDIMAGSFLSDEDLCGILDIPLS